MNTQPPTPTEVGARHTTLLHAIVFTSDLITHDTWGRPIEADDIRLPSYEGLVDTLVQQADELDALVAAANQFNGPHARTFLQGVHNSNIARLTSLRGVVERALVFESHDDCANALQRATSSMEADYNHHAPSRLGEWYADVTYWSLGGLRDLRRDASHLGDAGAQMAQDATALAKTTSDFIADLQGIASQFDVLDDDSLRGLIFDLNEKTILRTRMAADHTTQRLRPLIHIQSNAANRDNMPAQTPENIKAFLAPVHPADSADAASQERTKKRTDGEARGLILNNTPYELGETHSAYYAFGLEYVDNNLDKARSELATLTSLGTVLDQLDEPSRLEFLLGTHHEAVDRLSSRIMWAEKHLSPLQDELFPPCTAPDGWPTQADVIARRHNGNRWIVPCKDRYND